MELRHYVTLLRRWLWLIVLGTLLAGSAAFVVSKLTTPVYRATTTLLINQATGSMPITDYTSILTSQQLAKTYSELIKKSPILDQVIDHLKLDLTPDRLRAKLEVSLVRDTMLINISAEDENPQLAAAIVNEIASVFIEQTQALQRSRFASSEQNLANQLKQLQADIQANQKALEQARIASPLNQAEVVRLETTLSQYQNNYAALLKSYEDLRIIQARSVDNISVAEPAAIPDRPVRPQTLLNTLLAAVVGVMLAVGVAFLIEYLDDTIKSPDDVRDSLALTNMGIIAQFEHAEEPKSSLVVLSAPRSPISEAFRSLRTNIQFASVDRKIRTLMVTSPNPGEGKSTVAANLAIALAQAGSTVALVDADLRRPSVHRQFGLANSAGLTNAVLNEGGKLDGLLQTTGIENLQALSSGPLPPNPAELLGSERMGKILDNLKNVVDVIVIDTPPSLVVTDPAVLAKRADAVLLVVEMGSTRRESARQALEALQRVGANVVGTVINKLSVRRGGYYNYDYYYHYYYYYSSASGEKKKTRHRTSQPRGGWRGIMARLRGTSTPKPAVADTKPAPGASSE